MKDGLPSCRLVRLEHGHSVRVELSVNHASHFRRGNHERSRACGCNIKQRACVKSRDDKQVPIGCRCTGRKSDRVRVLVDNVGGHRSVHNAAKDAICIETHANEYDSQILGVPSQGAGPRDGYGSRLPSQSCPAKKVSERSRIIEACLSLRELRSSVARSKQERNLPLEARPDFDLGRQVQSTRGQPDNSPTGTVTHFSEQWMLALVVLSLETMTLASARHLILPPSKLGDVPESE